MVDDVEDGDGDDGCDVEPDGDVEGAFAPVSEGPEEVQSEKNPDDGDGNVDGPDELCVFLAAGEAQGEGDGGGDNDELPSPKVEAAEEITGEACFDEALERVVNAGEHHVANEGEDNGVGVKGAQPAEGEPSGVCVCLPESELGCGEHSDCHADNAPKQGRDAELAHDFVVVVDSDFVWGGSGFEGAATAVHDEWFSGLPYRLGGENRPEGGGARLLGFPRPRGSE